jgi:hypothetical protein
LEIIPDGTKVGLEVVELDFGKLGSLVDTDVVVFCTLVVIDITFKLTTAQFLDGAVIESEGVLLVVVFISIGRQFSLDFKDMVTVEFGEGSTEKKAFGFGVF